MASSSAYIPVCPKCGSTDVEIDFSNPVVWNYGAPSKNHCRSCGYVASVFPEVEIDSVSSYQKKKKQSSSSKEMASVGMDTETGFRVGLIEGLLGVISVIVGVIVFSVLASLVLGIVVVLFVVGGIGYLIYRKPWKK